MRNKIRRNHGSIQFSDDDGRQIDTSNPPGCYVCENTRNVRFIRLNSPRHKDTQFLRLCRDCLMFMNSENEEMRQQDGDEQWRKTQAG